MTPMDRLEAVATGQLGSFTAEQAHAAKVTRGQLRGRIQSGLLEPFGARSYRLRSVHPYLSNPLLAELVALVGDVGEPCYVSGPTAAALHGFDGYQLVPPFHLIVPRGRYVSRARAIIHTSIDLPLIDRETACDLPVLSPTRTIIDLARTETGARLAAAYDSALRDGLAIERAMHERIVALQGRGRYGLPKLLAVVNGFEVSRGGHSWLERRFLELTVGAGLPKPACQQVLTRASDRMVRVDCHYPGTPVVVELLGYRFHRTAAQMRQDAERANALTLAGHDVYQFVYVDVVERPDYVIGTVEHALTNVTV